MRYPATSSRWWLAGACHDTSSTADDIRRTWTLTGADRPSVTHKHTQVAKAKIHYSSSWFRYQDQKIDLRRITLHSLQSRDRKRVVAVFVLVLSSLDWTVEHLTSVTQCTTQCTHYSLFTMYLSEYIMFDLMHMLFALFCVGLLLAVVFVLVLGFSLVPVTVCYTLHDPLGTRKPWGPPGRSTHSSCGVSSLKIVLTGVSMGRRQKARVTKGQRIKGQSDNKANRTIGQWDKRPTPRNFFTLIRFYSHWYCVVQFPSHTRLSRLFVPWIIPIQMSWNSSSIYTVFYTFTSAKWTDFHNFFNT